MLLTAATVPALRRRLSCWRRRRPVLAALLVAAGGAEMMVLPFLGTPTAILQPGVAEAAGLGVSLPLLLIGVVLLRFPQLHSIAGVAAVSLAVLALLTCNIGGLLLGTGLGVVGGCLAFAWLPPRSPADTTTDLTADTTTGTTADPTTGTTVPPPRREPRPAATSEAAAPGSR
ncbi:DUF6114 domain-containing protein [Streptomyces sp. NPDC048845]|uniref:DUF6114 domain-containing protein n=1 Tax=Streptomyces sp. NPDC048845 TaxID=3155390 RepID=UPI003420466A